MIPSTPPIPTWKKNLKKSDVIYIENNKIFLNGTVVKGKKSLEETQPGCINLWKKVTEKHLKQQQQQQRKEIILLTRSLSINIKEGKQPRLQDLCKTICGGKNNLKKRFYAAFFKKSL